MVQFNMNILSPFIAFLLFIYLFNKIKKNYLFIFQREGEKKREREGTSRQGAEREGTENLKQVRAEIRDPDVGLELTSCEVMTWAKVRGLIYWTTQTPHGCVFLNPNSIFESLQKMWLFNEDYN